ncbi:MAG: GtrA family protein [Candidatus Marinimicrobia bacterium]|nr:GtrA family protein [Candidatus Neomarinimicrobiota bacterium]
MTKRRAQWGALWRDFHRRDAHPFAQFIKYAMAGGLATLTDILVFYSLSWFVFRALAPDDPLLRLLNLSVPALEESVRLRHFALNKALAFIASNMTAYLLNILWVFTRGRHRWYIELGLFYAVSGISFFLGTGLGGWLIYRFALSTTATYITAAFAALMINYVCRRFLIFKG